MDEAAPHPAETDPTQASGFGAPAGEQAPEPELETGVPARELATGDLLRELGSLHRTRNDTVRHGSTQALEHHNARMAELEEEYLRRFPDREIDPERLSDGARARSEPRVANGPARTGADQPWEPEDLVMAAGRDLTPENLAWARRKLAEEGPSAIERIVP